MSVARSAISECLKCHKIGWNRGNLKVILPDPLYTVKRERIEMINLIERLWRLMRGQMTCDQFYQNLKELAEAVMEWLEKRPFSKFCSLMGIDEALLIFVE